jgi:MarR family transcriptional regulator, organic hydroperoxide resistance regulator
VVDSILLALQRATHVSLDALATELAELGVPASELNVLANLGDGDGRTVSQLIADVGSRPTTMTTILDRLETRGWLARNPHPSDRRSFVVELTPEGRRIARTVRRGVARVEARALAGLSPTRLAALRGALASIAENAHG